MLSSDNTVPSSPQAGYWSVNEESKYDSSPASSPPGFPWEQQTNGDDLAKAPEKPEKSAFSLLGKRPAPASADSNVCSAKKPAINVPKRGTKSLTQMQISLGQEVQKKCNSCGMEYVTSSAEDRKLHDKYHKQNTEGYDVGKEFVQRARPHTVFNGVVTGDRICAIDCFDKYPRKRRAQTALDVVQRELGAVPIPEKKIWDFKESDALDNNMEPNFRAYMYIRGTKCVGYLLIERIKDARQVVEPAGSTGCAAHKARTPNTTATEALKARKQAEEEAAMRAASQPIQLSTSVYPARIGISRVWTSPTHRRQNIATKLLDTAVAHHRQRAARDKIRESTRPAYNPDLSQDAIKLLEEVCKPLEDIKGKEDVAFSQPTEVGARLARRWFGKLYGWGVYIV